MAYKDDKLKWSDGYAGKIFADGYFNLDLAVGGREHGSNQPAANQVTDMQLIFYFDFIIYRDGDKNIFPIGPNDKFTVTPPQLDYFSEKAKKNSAAIIWQFQSDLRRRGKPVYHDGRCDPAHGKISSLSKTPYTILMYNFYYAGTVEQAYGRTDWQDYLMSDPLLPEQVRMEIRFRSLPYTYM